MLESIIEIDQRLFLFLNGLQSNFWDEFFWIITETKTWIPFYFFLFVKTWHHLSAGYQVKMWKNLGMLAVAVGATITLADQTTSGFMKPFFERLRPSHDPVTAPFTEFYEYAKGHVYKGGKFGFASSHAANSFALFGLLSMIFKNKSITITLLIWAFFVSYSRIYLGVHYPGDILVGAMIGTLYGLLVGFLLNKLHSAWIGK